MPESFNITVRFTNFPYVVNNERVSEYVKEILQCEPRILRINRDREIHVALCDVTPAIIRDREINREKARLFTAWAEYAVGDVIVMVGELLTGMLRNGYEVHVPFYDWFYGEGMLKTYLATFGGAEVIYKGHAKSGDKLKIKLVKMLKNTLVIEAGSRKDVYFIPDDFDEKWLPFTVWPFFEWFFAQERYENFFIVMDELDKIIEVYDTKGMRKFYDVLNILRVMRALEVLGEKI